MENLKEKTARGLMWSTVNNGSAQLLNLIVGVFLARLLTPEDYGIVGVLTVFSAVAMTLQTSGFSQALVNERKPVDADYNSVFWFNILVSLLLYVLLFLCAPLIAAFFHQPCLVAVSRVLFLSLPVYALGVTSGAYLIKNMMNREIAVIGLSAIILSGFTAIVLALNGFTYWSLVAQQLVAAVVTIAGRYYYVRWLPKLRIDFGPVRRMFSFSARLLITNLIQIFNFHLLTFIFGRFLPIQTVGYYSQANKWNNLAKTTIADAVGQVAQAVLVSVSDEREREVRVFRKMMRFTAFLSFPAMLGLALVSREFILFVLGSQWADSVPLLQILCVGGAFLPFYTLYQNVAISSGRSDLYMWCSIGQMLIQLAIVLVTYPYGINTILWCCSAFNILWLLPWQIVAHRLIGVRLRDVLKDVLPFLMVVIVVMAFTYMLTTWIESYILMLVVRIGIFALVYIGLMKLLRVKIMEECIDFVLKKRRGYDSNV
mgnify:CR=1 FL=1